MLSQLRRWWTKKYQRSAKSDEFGRYTIYELLVEFWEDYFEEHPVESIKEAKDSDGNVQFRNTGDDLIDRWEEQLAQGLMPDLTEGMTDDEIQKLNREQKKASKGKVVDTLGEAQNIIESSRQQAVADKILRHGGPSFRLDGKVSDA